MISRIIKVAESVVSQRDPKAEADNTYLHLDNLFRISHKLNLIIVLFYILF